MLPPLALPSCTLPLPAKPVPARPAMLRRLLAPGSVHSTYAGQCNAGELEALTKMLMTCYCWPSTSKQSLAQR